jgi:hypothetical protein
MRRFVTGLLLALLAASPASAQITQGQVQASITNLPQGGNVSVANLQATLTLMNQAAFQGLSGNVSISNSPCAGCFLVGVSSSVANWTNSTPLSFLGTNVNPITADGSQITIQNSSTTAQNVYSGITGGVVYDALRSTVYIPAGSTVLNTEPFGAYVRNRSGSPSSPGVLFYGVCTTIANSSCFGWNPRLLDSEDGAGHSYTGIKLIGGEIDYDIRQASTVVSGISLQLASTVSFAASNGFQVTNNTPSFGKLANSFVSGDAAASVALFAGATAASGTSISSQTIKFNRFDGGGVEHADLLFDDSAGQLTWPGNINLNGPAATAIQISFQENSATGFVIGQTSGGNFFALDGANSNAFVWQMPSAGTFAFTPRVSFASAIISAGAVPTGNTGTCGTGVTVTGGAMTGTWTSTAICALAGTIILSGMPTAPTGYSCDMTDRTTNGVTVQQTATSATSATFTVRSLPTGSVQTVANDILQYKCIAY